MNISISTLLKEAQLTLNESNETTNVDVATFLAINSLASSQLAIAAMQYKKEHEVSNE